MHCVTMYSLPQVSAIKSGRAFHDMASTNIISSTTAESSITFRSAAEQISRLFLIFVPSSSRQINTIEDDGSKAGSKRTSVILSTFFSFSYYLCFSPFKFMLDESNKYFVYKFLPQQVSITCNLYI